MLRNERGGSMKWFVFAFFFFAPTLVQAQVPKGIPQLSKKVTWPEMLRMGLDQLDPSPWGPGIHIKVAYGVLQSGTLTGEPSFKQLAKKVSAIVGQIYKNPRLQKVMWKWASPSLRRAFAKLKKKDQQDYLKIFHYAAQYTLRHNHPAEKRYYDRLKKAGKLRDFTSKNRFGKSSDYRKVEAFVYRRVQQGVSLKAMGRFFRKVHRFLKPNLKRK